MVIRIKFAKYGFMRFIGHLDVLRYFQKAIRRSGIDVAYSGGYHPHQIMSFASPLGMGITSDGEYVDVELNTFTSKEDLISRLGAAMTEGFEIIDMTVLPEQEANKKKEAAMSQITCADYMIIFRADCNTFKSSDVLDSAVKTLCSQETIEVIKTTKSGEASIDIKPFIYSIETSYDKFMSSEKIVAADNNHTKHAIVSDNDVLLYLRLASGSKMNIKPELVINELYKIAGIDADRFSYRQHRMELYMLSGPFRPLIMNS